jgi:hypothetical protein
MKMASKVPRVTIADEPNRHGSHRRVRERKSETPVNNALHKTLSSALISAVIFNAYIVSITDNTPNAVFTFGVVYEYVAYLSVLGLYKIKLHDELEKTCRTQPVISKIQVQSVTFTFSYAIPCAVASLYR